MRINQFVAQATGLSRRTTDLAINSGRVSVNNKSAVIGQTVKITDRVLLDNKVIHAPKSQTTILLNKPSGYICSRDGQGAPTIYDLLPAKYHKLKHVGRLDKDSTGLVVLTDDGNLAHELSHPSFNKVKVYEVTLNKPLQGKDRLDIETGKVNLDDKPSIMKILKLKDKNSYQVKLSEGRNRQIRRTFEKLNYVVIGLKRTNFGKFNLNQLENKKFIIIEKAV
jgi:23S rRNA pseudouridine2605 synthase